MSKQLIERIVRDVAELSDRNSPEDQPDMMLVSAKELALIIENALPPEELLHPPRQVWFRAGLLACREYMARFVAAESPTIAESIRANWWPDLGQDFGAPRKILWEELTVGEFGTPEFRAKTADEVSPTQEALPIAFQFLIRHAGVNEEDQY
jgi:hypothetical protein